LTWGRPLLLSKEVPEGMPYVLKNKKTSEIFACTLINIYDFPYHGVKFWEYEDEAEAEYQMFLQQKEASLQDWELIEVEEHQLKMFNVKLKNNPQLRLFLNDEGKSFVKAQE
jgi:hypothetical protein